MCDNGEESHGVEASHRRVQFIKVDADALHVPFCDQARLVLDDGASLIPLDLEYPFQSNGFVATR
jgi:hypothetical protein